MIKILGKQYVDKLSQVLKEIHWDSIESLYNDIHKAWMNNNTVFFCGNGGSAGNANHIANDFLYGIAKKHGEGLSAVSLSSNSSILTCLANDIGYDKIYSEQLSVYAKKNDILVVLSGSGNSANINSVLDEAKEMNVKSHAILGFDGGKALKKADNSIHLSINDMQIAEDSQLIIAHIIMQKLYDIRNKF